MHAPGECVEIEGSDARKITRVLRKRTGDRVEIIDSATQRFAAILEVAQRSVRATLGERIQAAPQPARPAIAVAQAIPKGQKMDFVVEKLTELGVVEIVPFYSERTIPKRADNERVTLSLSKRERWRRLCRSAAQQSGRTEIPLVTPPEDFDALLDRFTRYDRVLFAWELAEAQLLREVLPPLLSGVQTILVVVGPEGGFSSEEAARARTRGAQHLWLGERILRTETAALVLVAILNYLT